MRLKVGIVFISISVSLLGCDSLNVLSGRQSAPSDFPGQHIVMSKEVYRWDGERLVIEHTFKNPFDHTIYMAGCADGAGPTDILEKRSQDEWKTVYSRICLDILTKPTEIGPGESYQATLKLGKEQLGQMQRKADSVPGTYRIREPMYWEWSMKKAQNEELKVTNWFSNEFDIDTDR